MAQYVKYNSDGTIEKWFPGYVVIDGLMTIINPRNPGEHGLELILQAGYVEYVVPEHVPVPRTSPDEDVILNAVKQLLASQVESLDDATALDVAALFPAWADKEGKAVSVGERLWYDGKLYKVIQAHTVQLDWTPDTASSLFAEVSVEEWPEFVQPTGAETAYNTGDKVTYNGKHYISLIDNNVWSPDDYPAGWEEQ